MGRCRRKRRLGAPAQRDGWSDYLFIVPRDFSAIAGEKMSMRHSPRKTPIETMSDAGGAGISDVA